MSAIVWHMCWHSISDRWMRWKRRAKEELSEVMEIGPVIAESVYDFFHNKAGRHAIVGTEEVGIDPQVAKPAADEPRPLAGQTIVVTGTLPTLGRTEIEADRQAGRKGFRERQQEDQLRRRRRIRGQQARKAKELKVPVLSEAEFLEKIGKKKEA